MTVTVAGFVQSSTHQMGSTFASASDDATVRIWDAISGLQVEVYTSHLHMVGCVAFSADGLHMASEMKKGRSMSGRKMPFTGP